MSCFKLYMCTLLILTLTVGVQLSTLSKRSPPLGGKVLRSNLLRISVSMVSGTSHSPYSAFTASLEKPIQSSPGVSNFSSSVSEMVATNLCVSSSRVKSLASCREEIRKSRPHVLYCRNCKIRY